MKVGVSSKESQSFLSPSEYRHKSVEIGRFWVSFEMMKFNYKRQNSYKRPYFRPPLTPPNSGGERGGTVYLTIFLPPTM